MALAAPAAQPKVRKIRVKSITGPIRVVNALSCSVITFKLVACSIDGKKSDGRDLTADEAKKIKWVIKEARASLGKSPKLVAGRSLATGSGMMFQYVLDFPAEALVVIAYVDSSAQGVSHWVKVSSSAGFEKSGSTHASLTKYPEIKDVEKLEETFKANWKAFQAALEAAGADVRINSTLRSRERAYMMHYSPLVANGKIKPWEVPDSIHIRSESSHARVEWTHTDSNGRVDEKASRQGAREMMRVFDIAYPAALNSNHVHGKAVDVAIKWTGTLKVKDNKGKEHEIKTAPRHGGTSAEPSGNKELKTVAETYGVKKLLLKDPPHWSENGY